MPSTAQLQEQMNDKMVSHNDYSGTLDTWCE